MKTLQYLLFAAALILTASCGDDNDPADCTSASFNQEVNAAINDVNAAGQAYANDPSTDNCNAFKDAANDYLDVVEDLDGCAGISAADYDQALDAARAAVNSIPGC